jgi:hypothetical protein
LDRADDILHFSELQNGGGEAGEIGETHAVPKQSGRTFASPSAQNLLNRPENAG